MLGSILWPLGGCVSVNLGAGKTARSEDVEFVAPTTPFEQLSNSRADGAWQNPENGNSISFFSSCDDAADPSLESVIRDLFIDLKEMKTLRSEASIFNGREAQIAEVEGLIDGVKTRIHAVVFKKNNCLYTLSYIGVSTAFDHDHGRFDDFTRSFKAP